MRTITGCYPSPSPHTTDHLAAKLSAPKRTFSSSSFYKTQNFKARLILSSMAAPLQVSASSTIGAKSVELETATSGLVGENDLLIVGPGVLGRLVAERWRQEHPGCQIYGQTVTSDHHDELIKLGINPSLKVTNATLQYPYVIFCAPPSRTSDYPGDVRIVCLNKGAGELHTHQRKTTLKFVIGCMFYAYAISLDHGPNREAALSWNGEGSFLFTSSSAPYDCFDNGQCNEDSPVLAIGRSPRIDVLLKAEKIVLETGGCVVRLAGLYKADRGAHTYWLEKGTVEIRPDHILNLIHYKDAASLCVAILKKKLRGRIFLGCDNHPLSRQEVMELVTKSGKFSKKFGAFTGTSDPLGKRLNNSKTRAELGWEPKYPSFGHFLGVSQ